MGIIPVEEIVGRGWQRYKKIIAMGLIEERNRRCSRLVRAQREA